MNIGDTLIIGKPGDLYEVRKLSAGGVWEPLRGTDVSGLTSARDVARVSLEPNGTEIWYRLADEPDSMIRLL